MKKEDINRILGISENYEMPSRLMQILLNENEKKKMFNEFLSIEQNLSHDWFTDYYQEEHGDRNSLKQDFTPDCICQIISGIAGQGNSIADICAGTGGLTIKMWTQNPEARFYCEEISSRTVPVLLFNLAIRNMQGKVIHANSLTGEIENIYQLEKTNDFSRITVTEDTEYNADIVVMNPPYSLKWSPEGMEQDARFESFALAPKTKADYAFVLHGLHKLTDNGTLVAVLPHGVLFRGSREAEIRQKMIEKKLLEAVIGLPEGLFLNTQIPVCLLVIKKRKNDDRIQIIDASKEFDKGKPQNIMKDAHVQKVIDAYRSRREIEKLSHVANRAEIQSNEYNLNIPRYVDTTEREPVPDLLETIEELFWTEKEIRDAEIRLFGMMQELVGTNEEGDRELQKAIAKYRRYVKNKYQYADNAEQMEILI